MKKLFIFVVVAVSCSLLTMAASPNRISGSYAEVRGNDIYVGACFANAQQGLIGKEGMLAWNIQSGEYNGVSLKGLSLMAVLYGNTTLGDKFAGDLQRIKSVLIYDSRASEAQRHALRAFALAAAGKNLGAIVREEIAPITYEQRVCEQNEGPAGHEAHGEHAGGCVSVTAGSLASFQTRSMLHSDNLCSMAEHFGSPLSNGVRNETAVFVPKNTFRGSGLGTQWSIPDMRGGFVGTFEFAGPVTH